VYTASCCKVLLLCVATSATPVGDLVCVPVAEACVKRVPLLREQRADVLQARNLELVRPAHPDLPARPQQQLAVLSTIHKPDTCVHIQRIRQREVLLGAPTFVRCLPTCPFKAMPQCGLDQAASHRPAAQNKFTACSCNATQHTSKWQLASFFSGTSTTHAASGPLRASCHL
jgi:hypothetical protein